MLLDDSQIAVWWIKQSNKRWNVWVQSRVEIIRNNISSVHWFHCTFIPKSSWLSNSLHSIAYHWSFIMAEGTFVFVTGCWALAISGFHFVIIIGNDEEAVSESTVMMVNSKPEEISDVIDCTKFSSLDKLLRVTSYVSRFISNAKFRICKSEVILNDVNIWNKG